MGRNQKKILIILGVLTVFSVILMIGMLKLGEVAFSNMCGPVGGFLMQPVPTEDGYCFNVSGTPIQLNVTPFNDTCAPYPEQGRWTPSPATEGFCQNWYGTFIPVTPTPAGG